MAKRIIGSSLAGVSIVFMALGFGVNPLGAVGAGLFAALITNYVFLGEA